MLYNDIDLPRGFTAEENQKYLLEYKKGNKELETLLIEHNLRLVISMVQKYFNNIMLNNYFLNFDELVSLGNLALIKAIRSFDVEKKIKFSAYVTICIKNEILMQLKKSKKRIKTESFEKKISQNLSGASFCLKDIIKDEETVEDKYLDKELIDSAINGLRILNENEKEIIKLYYKNEFTQAKIADMMKCSQGRISKIHNSALIKLRCYFKSIDLINNNDIIQTKKKKILNNNIKIKRSNGEK